MKTIEQIAYGKPKNVGPTCGLSSVDVQAKIEIAGVKHAGMVTHVCSELKEPYHEVCVCKCGMRWVRNVK